MKMSVNKYELDSELINYGGFNNYKKKINI